MLSPIIGLTAGDLAGIGPEILAKTITALEKDHSILEGLEYRIIGASSPLTPGQPSKKSSQAALHSLELAATAALDQEVGAIVTGPVSKYQLHQIGFSYPGQTEFFAARANCSNYAMLLTGGKLTVALVTTHLPLSEAITTLSTREIIRVGGLLVNFLKCRYQKQPHQKLNIGVPGLNPHAGENGDLGSEEKNIIIPAIKILRQRYPEVTFSDPESPDTIFWKAIHPLPQQNQEKVFDAILCLYHDQGLIPLKLHAFDQGVNMTLGLPFIRTSPDHGTAYNLAGTNQANHCSYLAAVKLAAEMLRKSF